MDGVAMSELWWWLEKQVREGNEDLNEFNVGEKVSSLRAEQAGYVEESFPSIVGEGPHGAIVHYRATEKSARKITKDSIILLDSGGQFLCGTTDVTRTHHLGTPSAYEKMCYTRVLKGHIALDTATFPVGTPGMALDTFARQHLWSAGLDYRHGTWPRRRRRVECTRRPAEHFSSMGEHDAYYRWNDCLQRTRILRRR